jgi:hypothetical protein
MIARENKDRVVGAVFLIGLGILFTPLSAVVGGFFPGILFVIGATALTHGMVEGEGHDQVYGGLFLLGLGTVFLLGFNLPLLLIGLGVLMLLGFNHKPDWFSHQNHSTHHHNLSRKQYVPEQEDVEFAVDKRKHDEYV